MTVWRIYWNLKLFLPFPAIKYIYLDWEQAGEVNYFSPIVGGFCGSALSCTIIACSMTA